MVDALRNPGRSVEGVTLFVEGRKSSPEMVALKAVVPDEVSVEPMGSSRDVRSGAEGLSEVHPNYYFLIDRDHLPEKQVEKAWREVTDPAASNLLIWRRREIENYFIDPDFAEHSDYLNVETENLRRELLKRCRQRLYLDVANSVVIELREQLKTTWIRPAGNPADYEDREGALESLMSRSEFREYPEAVSETLSREEIESLFNQFEQAFVGDAGSIDFESGEWLKRIAGKQILKELLNNTGAFRVTNRDDEVVQGDSATREFMANLAAKREVWPADFTRLHDLLAEEVEEIWAG